MRVRRGGAGGDDDLVGALRHAAVGEPRVGKPHYAPGAGTLGGRARARRPRRRQRAQRGNDKRRGHRPQALGRGDVVAALELIGDVKHARGDRRDHPALGPQLLLDMTRLGGGAVAARRRQAQARPGRQETNRGTRLHVHPRAAHVPRPRAQQPLALRQGVAHRDVDLHHACGVESAPRVEAMSRARQRRGRRPPLRLPVTVGRHAGKQQCCDKQRRQGPGQLCSHGNVPSGEMGARGCLCIQY